MTPSEQIKEKLDIVEFIRSYIQIFPAGRNFKAVCPFHKEKTPSFIVSPERQTWHCFGSCSEGGDIFKFLMKYENLEFYEVLKILAEKAGIELKKFSSFEQRQFDVLYDINNFAINFFKNNLSANKEALEYLQGRGLREETIKEFDVGFSLPDFDKLTLYLLKSGFAVKDIERAGLSFKTEKGSYIDRFRGRIMFPIFNHAGKNVGFSARILPRLDKGDMGKYINSPETPIFNKSKILYGFNKSKSLIRDEKVAVLMEGQMDILMSWQDGVRNAVASSGTALTAEHLKVLRRYADDLIFCFDNDEAGLKAAERSIDLANNFDFGVKLLIIEDAKDPAELVQKQPGIFGKMLKEKSETAMNFYFKRYLKDSEAKQGDNISGLKQNLRIILSKIKNLSSPIERAHWIKELSIAVNIKEEALLEEMAVLKSETNNFQIEPYLAPLKSSDNFSIIGGQFQKAENRKDLILQRLLSLMLIKKELADGLDEYLYYFSGDYLKIAEIMANSEKIIDKQLSDLFDLINLRASFESQFIEQKNIDAEFKDLLHYLRLEHLKEKRQELLKKIKEAEKNGNNETMSSVLKEFDAVSKMIHN